MIAASIAAIAFIMCAGWVYYLIVTAPWGWQDEDGFHEGKKDD